MKFLLPLFLLFSCCAAEVPVSAQDTTYISAAFKPADAAKASYYQVKTKSAAGWKVASYYISGKQHMTGEYADDSLHLKIGEFTWYEPNGTVSHRCIYGNDKLEGSETFYYPNGKVQITGNNRNDHPDGEWTGYYPSGKISGKATYKNGSQASAEFFNPDGSSNKEMKIFRRDADFPGGPSAWLKFLNKTFRYPDQAVDKEIGGTVLVAFKVSKDGMIMNPVVVEPVHKLLDQEALRVIRESPEWQPAIMGGIYCESLKRQPIIFVFPENARKKK